MDIPASTIRNASLVAILLAAATTSHLHAQHAGDIGLAVTDARIATAEVGTGGLGPARRAFSATLGETAPWFSDEPGFDGEPGTFVPGTRVGFRFAAPLLAWDGTSFGPTDPAGSAAGERMRVSYVTLGATTGSAPAPGFDLAVQADGGWHRHLAFTLLAAPGAAEPDAGVYMLTLEMTSTDPGMAASRPFVIVFNGGADDATFAAAFAAAEAALQPPCPADITGDRAVDGADLGALLGAWGTCPGGTAGCTGDLDGNGIVNGADLGVLLGAWGPCP